MENMRKVLNEILKDDLKPGEVVADLRLALGVSQEKLEEITGIAISNISALERGRIEMTIHYALIFAAALGVHPSEILFPNGKFEKTSEILKIQKKAATLIKKQSD